MTEEIRDLDDSRTDAIRRTRVASSLGDYEILEKIGEGSMGTVYKGTDLSRNRPVAIKFLTREISDNPQLLQRFQREIQLAIKMRHPNIIEGYAAGVWEDCIHYFVMEYVDGVTLTEYMARERMTEEKAVDIVLQVARALGHVNEFGLVHRDVKPENVMITRQGIAKLADLGLAKFAEGDTELTMAGTVVGTPLYMSPEQARGTGLVDIRSDLYSLGATFYHLLTGSPPFKGQSAPEVIAKQIQEEPVAPREVDPTISPGAQYVVLRTLAKDPAMRYQTPQELAQDLELLKAGRGGAGEEGTPWGGGAAPAAEEVPFGFVPSEDDVKIGAAAVSNGLISPDALARCLDEQERLARGGFALKLTHVATEQRLLDEEQVRRLESALRKQREKEAEALYGKLAVKQKFITEEQLAGCLRAQGELSEAGKPQRIAEVLRGKGYLQAAQAEVVLATQGRLRHGKEDEEVAALATAAGLLSAGQAERAKLIQGNEVVMGIYRPIGDVLVDRKYVSPPMRDAILRAVRRARMTGRPAAEILAAHRAGAGAAAPPAPDESVVAKYRQRISEHVQAGIAHRKAYRYYAAIAEWEKVLGILSAHTEAEHLIEETRTLVANLEARRSRGERLLASALRDWEHYAKLNPVDGSLSDLVSTARERLARLDGSPARAPPPPPAVARRPRTPPPDPVPPEEVAEEADAARADRAVRQGQRAEEAERAADAWSRYCEALAIEPGNTAALGGLERLARRSRRRSLGWAFTVLVLLAGAATGAVAWVGPPRAEAWLLRLLGGF
ncbi:MAG: serine/threonine protein kinase [Planctomycetales bacterium]|nr:serine/threonine protein kinase [Planctomycetales bacterium]